MARRAIIFGGAGFLGSHIATKMLQAGWDVVVIDGLLEETGGSEQNLQNITDRILFIKERVEMMDVRDDRMAGADVVIAAMGWTRHLAAFANPMRDLEYNLVSHLYLLRYMTHITGTLLIYLGSRGQYGNYAGDKLDESAPMTPIDIQGIHKLAAESHYRVAAERGSFQVASLRLPNCFGERQLTQGEDIGLVGELIRRALAQERVTVYGSGRNRNIVYAGDVAEIVCHIARNAERISGFHAFNVAGHEIAIRTLAQKIIQLVESGELEEAVVPEHILKVDTGNARYEGQRLRKSFPSIPPVRDLNDSLSRTISYFRGIPA